MMSVIAPMDEVLRMFGRFFVVSVPAADTNVSYAFRVRFCSAKAAASY